jgi:hypothetical protein
LYKQRSERSMRRELMVNKLMQHAFWFFWLWNIYTKYMVNLVNMPVSRERMERYQNRHYRQIEHAAKVY